MLKADDIVKILDAAARGGVQHLKFGSLQVDFVPKVSDITIPASALLDLPPSEERQESFEEKANRLLIEDPAAYERLLESGDAAE